MAEVLQAEWLDQNSLRNYPFLENSQRRPSVAGTVMADLALPNYLITDFVITIPADLPSTLYLMKVAKIGDAITFVIGCSEKTVASIFINSEKHRTNTAYAFNGVDDYSAAKGCIVVGDLDRFKTYMPDGVYNFDYEETRFEYRCIRPSLQGVSSLSVYDRTTGHTSKKLTGDVRLVAGDNVILTYNNKLNAIVINADSNSEYNDECDCGNSSKILTINGISAQDITIVGDDCVSVTRTGHTLKISDKCSKQCCGCAELDFINEKISQLSTAINKLDNYTTVMSTRLTELQASYVQTYSGKTSE